jgi:hypothetical protein
MMSVLFSVARLAILMLARTHNAGAIHLPTELDAQGALTAKSTAVRFAATKAHTDKTINACVVGPWNTCGGDGYVGCINCADGYFCYTENKWYSQCKPDPATPAVTVAPTTKPTAKPSAVPTSASPTTTVSPTVKPSSAAPATASPTTTAKPSAAPSARPGTASPTRMPTVESIYPPRLPDKSQDLQTKLANAVPGDIITFDGAFIPTAYLRTIVNGLVDAPITVRGIGPNAVIYGSYLNKTTVFFEAALKILHSNYIFENFLIVNSKKAMMGEHASNVTLRNVHVVGTNEEAFKIHHQSEYWLVDGCSATLTGLTGKFGEGFYLGDAYPHNWPAGDLFGARHITIQNCLAIGTQDNGYDVKVRKNTQSFASLTLPSLSIHYRSRMDFAVIVQRLHRDCAEIAQ